VVRGGVVDYCGVCHSDLHAIHGLVGKPTDGLVPGHEFTGTVTAVGVAVTGFAPRRAGRRRHDRRLLRGLREGSTTLILK
jgi:NADPH:quinone reductase-like Zn-dependent oxidoreductase